MNCLDRVTIQEYIDGEMDLSRSSMIDQHIEVCARCRSLHEESLEAKAYILGILDLMDGIQEQPKVPRMHREGPEKRYSPTKKGVISAISVAAGMATVLGLLFSPNRNLPPEQMTTGDAELLMLELIGDAEPNDSWHNSQMVIILTNDHGEVIQSYVSDEP